MHEAAFVKLQHHQIARKLHRRWPENVLSAPSDVIGRGYQIRQYAVGGRAWSIGAGRATGHGFVAPRRRASRKAVHSWVREGWSSRSRHNLSQSVVSWYVPTIITE